MTRPLAPAALAVVAALAACGAPGRAERIGTRPDGGSIMLSANNDKAWESAREIMKSHCDGKYRVVAQVQEQGQGRTPGVKPPAAPGPMGDPMDQAGAPYGLRVDYECAGRNGALDQPNPPRN
jgi:uncharacterized lipoprotein